MATKRDQLQAFQFLAQRTISALVTRESDPEQPPFRRPGAAAIGSVVIGAIALVVTVVIGMVSPGGNKAWEDGKSVIVVSETGTRYVYLNGNLHPVRNYTSALLAMNDNAETVSVSRNSLMDVPRGPLIGIPDAPDSLPAAEEISSGSWTQCTRPAPDSTGTTVDQSVLLAGTEPTGGKDFGAAAMLVKARETGVEYLIWNGYRHKIDARNTVTVGLALRSEPQARVGMAFVNTLPEGEPIAPIAVQGVGQRSTAVPRRPDIRVGQLFTAKTSDGATQHYLAERDSLRPISELQYDIQLAYEPTRRAYEGAEPVGVPLGLAAAAEANKQQLPNPVMGAAPAQRPAFVGSARDRATVCATFADGQFVPVLRVDPTLPTSDPMSGTQLRTSRGTPLADEVYVRPGSGVLVQVMSSPQAPSGTLALVTDQGRAYPLASPEVARVLGYEGVKPVKIPGRLVARIPMGSGLDPEAARDT